MTRPEVTKSRAATAAFFLFAAALVLGLALGATPGEASLPRSAAPTALNVAVPDAAALDGEASATILRSAVASDLDDDALDHAPDDTPRLGFAEDLCLLEPDHAQAGFATFGRETCRCERTYARNNPLKYLDPDGRASVSHLRQQAVARAWEQERQLVIATGRGTRQWTHAEMQELVATGRVGGYYGHHINNVASRPDLAGDPANIDFANRPEHYARHNNGRFRLPTSGPLLSRTLGLLPVASLALDAWSQYREASATGIATSLMGTTSLFDVSAAATTLDGGYISVSQELGGILQARDGAFYRLGCDGGGPECMVNAEKLTGASFTVVEVY